MIVSRQRILNHLVGLAMLGAVVGCGGDGLDRQAISGNVTFENEPLEQGQINFYPEQSNAEAITAGAPVENGQYSISRAQGLVPGQYVVRIYSAAGEAEGSVEPALDADGMPGLGQLNLPELIPTKYNAQSTLTAEVTSDGPNEFDYQLTK